MNQNQRNVLTVGVVLAALMAAFPPWIYRQVRGEGIVVERNAGRICAFAPPSTQDYGRIARLFAYEDDFVPSAEPVARQDGTRYVSTPPRNGMLTFTTPLVVQGLPAQTAVEKIAEKEWLFRVSIDFPQFFVQLLTLSLTTASLMLILHKPVRTA